MERRHYDRVMANADRDPVTGCLVSRYSTGSHGYAQAWDGSRNVLAHRLVWGFVNGPIPEGMTVDHRQGKCPRTCIEITHLRLLPNRENARRNGGEDFPLGGCRHGHPDSELRTYTRSGGRKTLGCSRCRADMQRRYRERVASRSAEGRR